MQWNVMGCKEMGWEACVKQAGSPWVGGYATLGIHVYAWVLMFPSPPLAGASPLPECDEQPEEWCRDVGTAAKCGVLELCRLTVWDQPVGVTATGGMRGIDLPIIQGWEVGRYRGSGAKTAS